MEYQNISYFVEYFHAICNLKTGAGLITSQNTGALLIMKLLVSLQMYQLRQCSDVE